MADQTRNKRRWCFHTLAEQRMEMAFAGHCEIYSSSYVMDGIRNQAQRQER